MVLDLALVLRVSLALKLVRAVLQDVSDGLLALLEDPGEVEVWRNFPQILDFEAHFAVDALYLLFLAYRQDNAA